MEEREYVIDKMKNKLDDCRLCFSSTNVTVHIGQQVDKNTSIVEKIEYCTSLIVKVDDDFPQNICTTCAENLDLIYNFKSKAIACDLELSRNVHKDTHFTYIQVSDDPLNITYKLDLEEQDSSADLFDSCLYNIVDGDELIIEPVTVDTNSKSTVYIDENASTIKELMNNDKKKSDVIEKKLNGNLNSYRGSNTNNQNKSTSVDLKRNADISLFDSEKRRSKKLKTENEVDNEKPLVIVKNGKVVYICGECNFEAESMMFLVNHRARFHLDMGSFKCSECPTYYKTSGLLKRHMSMYHSVTHICKYCEKRFSNKQSLDRHTNCHHNDDKTPLEFQCVTCNAYFDTMDKMEDHFVVHYTNPSSTFSCNHCDRIFTTYAAKNKHIDLEHMIEIECGICHVVLPTKEAMDKHNNSVHQPKKKENKMYECTTCGKYFSGIKEVLNHRETHLSKNV